MIMKKAIILALAIAATLNLAAQKTCDKKLNDKKCQAKEWMTKMQEKRKAYIIGKMELNETERASFESIYDTYRTSYAKSRGVMRRAAHQMNDSCSNEQYEKSLEIINNEKNQQAKLDSEFYLAMKKVLSARQIYLYYKADKAFNKLMMKDMRKKKEKCKK